MRKGTDSPATLEVGRAAMPDEYTQMYDVTPKQKPQTVIGNTNVVYKSLFFGNSMVSFFL